MLGISLSDTTRYMITHGTLQKDMYSATDDKIEILFPDGTVRDIAEASDMLNVSLLEKKVRKHILCYHRLELS